MEEHCVTDQGQVNTQMLVVCNNTHIVQTPPYVILYLAAINPLATYAWQVMGTGQQVVQGCYYCCSERPNTQYARILIFAIITGAFTFMIVVTCDAMQYWGCFSMEVGIHSRPMAVMHCGKQDAVLQWLHGLVHGYNAWLDLLCQVVKMINSFTYTESPAVVPRSMLQSNH